MIAAIAEVFFLSAIAAITAMVAIIWTPGFKLIMAYFKRRIAYRKTSILTVYHYEKALKASRLFTVPYFSVRSFRYTASYRHGYLEFQMYRGGGRQGL